MTPEPPIPLCIADMYVMFVAALERGDFAGADRWAGVLFRLNDSEVRPSARGRDG